MKTIKIPVKQIEEEYVLNEDCALDEPWVFECPHYSSHLESYEADTIDNQGEHTTYSYPVMECDQCGEVTDDDPEDPREEYHCDDDY